MWCEAVAPGSGCNVDVPFPSVKCSYVFYIHIVLHTLFIYIFNELSTVYSMTTPAAWNKCHKIKGLENNKLESGKWLWLNLRHHPAIYLVRQEVGKEEERGGVILFNPLKDNFS